MDPIDLRSDTVTRPTPEMRRAMAEAEVGDETYREDPTVRRLEERAAELLGKAAGLLVLSGTMGNLVAILALTRRGDAVLVGDASHIYINEGGNLGAIGALSARPIPAPGGVITPEQIAAAACGCTSTAPESSTPPPLMACPRLIWCAARTPSPSA